MTLLRLTARSITSFLKRISEFAPDELPVAEEVLDDSLDESHESGYFTIVALKNGRPVGYVTYGNTPLSKGNWEIYWVAVDPVRTGTGHRAGTDLLRTEKPRSNNAAGGRLLSKHRRRRCMKKPAGSHKKCGYTEIARIPDFYDRGDDLVIFYKKLE